MGDGWRCDLMITQSRIGLAAGWLIVDREVRDWKLRAPLSPVQGIL